MGAQPHVPAEPRPTQGRRRVQRSTAKQIAPAYVSPADESQRTCTRAFLRRSFAHKRWSRISPRTACMVTPPKPWVLDHEQRRRRERHHLIRAASWAPTAAEKGACLEALVGQKTGRRDHSRPASHFGVESHQTIRSKCDRLPSPLSHSTFPSRRLLFVSKLRQTL